MRFPTALVGALQSVYSFISFLVRVLFQIFNPAILPIKIPLSKQYLPKITVKLLEFDPIFPPYLPPMLGAVFGWRVSDTTPL